MKIQEVSTNFQTGFFWGLGFTVAFVLVSWLMAFLFHFRVGAV